MTIGFTFKADRTTLTGVHIVNGQETAIKDGKIEGNNVSLTVTLDLGLGFSTVRGAWLLPQQRLPSRSHSPVKPCPFRLE